MTIKACDTSLNDFDLLERSCKNERYFTMLYQRYNQWLYGLLYQRTGDRETSCSICNDIWLKVWDDRKTILQNRKEYPNIKGYLFVKATSRLIDSLRSRRNMQMELSIDDENEMMLVEKLLSESVGNLDNEVDANSTTEYVRNLLESIEKNILDRTLFWKIRMEGYSVQEMARAECLTESTIRSKLCRLGMKLRELRPGLDLFLFLLCICPPI